MSYEQLRYNEVRQKSSHNAFQRAEGIYDQVAYWRVRSLEVDLHRGKPFRPKLKHDWYIYHIAALDPDTTVDRMSDFLQICHGVQTAIPDHEVITVFLDAKDPFHTSPSAAQSGAALDKLLVGALGKDGLFRPSDLLARAPGATSLQDAVAAAGWPTLGELRGKFVVVLTGGDDELATYADASTAGGRVAFLSSRITKAENVPGEPHVVFYNMDGKDVKLARAVHGHGLVSRAYYVDDRRRWRRAVDHSCHHIATDHVNSRVDPWAKTRRATGFPFQSLEGHTPSVTEAGRVCGVWARSGDIWGTRDSFLYHYRTCADAIDNRYELCISGPNSKVEDWIKGGVIARAGLARGSAYFGVFRIGEHHGLRIQYRVATNGSTVSEERDIGPDGLDPDTLAFVKLAVSRRGRRARAWGSSDGVQWTELGSYDFAEPLKHQGIGVSSHGAARGAKFMFCVPRDLPRPPFNLTRLVGGRDSHDRGWVDWDGNRRWKVDRFGDSAA